MKHFNFFKQFFELTTFFPFKYLQHFSVVRLIESCLTTYKQQHVT